MADGLFGLAADELGYPFNQVPTHAYWSQRGGVAGWGSICGALTPAAVFISYVTDEETQMQLVNELMAWYQQAPFPMYQPDGEVLQTVADSTLCHVSVTKWHHASGHDKQSDEKKWRCGGLSADVAKFTVQMLNDYADGTFESQYSPAAIVGECQACHSPLTQGKDNCVMCHTDPQPADLHEPFMP